jgi:hypothetical protein
MLINYWRSFNWQVGPFITKDDKSVLDESKACYYQSYSDYISSPDFVKDKPIFHLGLLPSPYCGNLSSARVFILMLNPGFSPLNYFAEETSISLKDEIIKTGRQENIDSEYPFFFLNPKFVWTGGGDYWTTKFRDILDHLYKQTNNYPKALSVLSKNIATIELLPYHSENFKLTGSVLKRMQSAILIKEFVKTNLIPRARKGEILIVVTRKAKHWEMRNNPRNNIVVYDGQSARAAHLSINSPGGSRIVKFLNL